MYECMREVKCGLKKQRGEVGGRNGNRSCVCGRF